MCTPHALAETDDHMVFNEDHVSSKVKMCSCLIIVLSSWFSLFLLIPDLGPGLSTLERCLKGLLGPSLDVRQRVL